MFCIALGETIKYLRARIDDSTKTRIQFADPKPGNKYWQIYDSR